MLDDATLSAAVLEREAATLETVLDAVVVASGPDTWQGPAADQFTSALEDRRRRLRALADDLRAAARRQRVQLIAGDAETAITPPLGITRRGVL